MTAYRFHSHHLASAGELGAMPLGTPLGFVVTITMLLLACLWGNADPLGALASYFDIPSVFCTIGGTTGVFMIAFTPDEYRGILKYFKKIFNPPNYDPATVIPTLVSFAEKARREGLLSLEDNIEEIDDQFLKRSLQLVVDGTDPDLIRAIMTIRKNKTEDRHNSAISVFGFIENRAPAFGLIGTILGLVLLLKNLSDPAALGPSLAIALLTTFYGVILANAFCGPIATKLGGLNDSESLMQTIIFEGVLSIQSGDNPRILQEKLLAFLPASEAQKLMTNEGEAK